MKLHSEGAAGESLDWSSLVGMPPLKARLEPWMRSNATRQQIYRGMERYGSPLNVINTKPFLRNLNRMREVGKDRGVELELLFARKANKCLSFVEACGESGYGVDVASEAELEQTLTCGLPARMIFCTAAVKSRRLIDRCVEKGVCITLDNRDELLAVVESGRELNCRPQVALRIGGFEVQGERLDSRFGFPLNSVDSILADPSWRELDSLGLHFHLHGYRHDHRVSALCACMKVCDRIKRETGVVLKFIDCGGGVPMSYLESEDEWDGFWKAHERALLGEGKPVTFDNDTYGKIVSEKRIYGRAQTYPFFQTNVQADWIGKMLDSPTDEGQTVAAALTRRGLTLRMEPGRSALDGCGLTAAEVVFRKCHSNGESLIGLAMNHTQCRTSSVDFFADPLLLSAAVGDDCRTPLREAYFVGAYCTESEFLSMRKFRFPKGVRVGDVVVFPNTAGYFMHFLESRSHQFQLAKNLNITDGCFRLDQIDEAD